MFQPRSIQSSLSFRDKIMMIDFTLVGSILSVWLGLIYQMLATGTSNLVSQIIELSER